MLKLHTLVLTLAMTTAFVAAADEKQLFNGKDLSGWEGNPASWSVQDGYITGVTTDAEPLPHNQFLIWKGGTVKNFELRAIMRQAGNNSGLQYRSQPLKDVGPWAIGGYQCDVHPTAANNAMMYDEKGRGIIALNGQSVIIDEQGKKWLTAQREAVTVDVADWNEYTIIAQGNKLIHKVNGKVTAEVIDHQASERDMEGLLAIQIHRGPAMRVQIKQIVLKELPDGGVLTPKDAPVPADAKEIVPPPRPGKKGGKGKAKK